MKKILQSTFMFFSFLFIGIIGIVVFLAIPIIFIVFLDTFIPLIFSILIGILLLICLGSLSCTKKFEKIIDKVFKKIQSPLF